VSILVDSSFVIDHLRGDAAAARRWARVFDEGDRTYITEIVVCEVRAGLRDEDEPLFDAFLRPIEFVQPAVETALLAGRWRYAAQRRGRTLSLADALIAAAADLLGAAVVTRNVRDFSLTPVRVEGY
jgi:predicted nucleic acid-binding protein